jgi:hypothetical protein
LGINTKVINGDKPQLDVSEIVKSLVALESDLKQINAPPPREETYAPCEDDSLIDQAVAIIIDKADCAIEGQGGDLQTYKVALQIACLGGDLSHLQEYNYEKCQPTWEDKDLQRKWDCAKEKAILKPESYLKAIIRNHTNPQKGT